MSETVVKELGKYSLSVDIDEFPIDPRENCNLGKMACFHGRYRFGDDDIPFHSGDFDSWAEMEEYIEFKLKAATWLPIYLYDHSGQTIATTPFSCPWDSGQIGFIYCTKEDIRKYRGAKRCTKKLIQEAEQTLESEVKEYDQYISGEQYCWRIEDDSGEHVDGCCGYYSEEDAEKDGLETLESLHEDAERIRIEQQQHVLYLRSQEEGNRCTVPADS
jgi:hypothetical protein